MKPIAQASSRDVRGSVLIFVVLILMVGALVLGGVAQRAATQNLSSAVELDLAERRVLLRNSRALARQFVQQSMFYGFMPFPPGEAGSVFTAGFTNAAIGGFSITNNDASIDFWQTVSEAGTAANVNPFSPMERGGFYRVILPAGLWNGLGTVGWNYLVRTRSPIAAGYSLVLQRPAVRPSSAITFENNPYIDFIDAPAWVGFPGMPVVPVSSVTNTNVDSTGYTGFLDVPLTIAGADGLPEEGIVRWEAVPNEESITGWLCEIDLRVDTGDRPSAYEYSVVSERLPPPGATNTNLVTVPVVSVRLIGTESADLSPLQLRMTDCPDVSELQLIGGNNRSLYINRQADLTDLMVVMNEAPRWRMGITMQGAPILLLAPGLVEFIGGVRTDTAVAVDSAALVVTPDADPGSLDVIGDRLMWLEDSRQ